MLRKETTTRETLTVIDKKWIKTVMRLCSVLEINKDLKDYYKIQLFLIENDKKIVNFLGNKIIKEKINIFYDKNANKIGYTMIDNINKNLNAITVIPKYRNLGYGREMLKDYIQGRKMCSVFEVLKTNKDWFNKQQFVEFREYIKHGIIYYDMMYYNDFKLYNHIKYVVETKGCKPHEIILNLGAELK